MDNSQRIPDHDDDGEPIEVYRAANLVEAHMLRSLLEDAGIRVRVDPGGLEGTIGESPLSWDALPRIAVRADQAVAARGLIEQAVADRESAETAEADDRERCLQCGALLPSDAETCRQCGWTFAAPES